MIRPFGDTNLFEIAINKLLKSKIPKENLYIAIGDKELIEITSKYDVNIFQVKNKVIVSQNSKKIIIKKTGIGNKNYEFANDRPASYGIIAIIFAIIAGLIAATAFRRL